MALTSVRNPSRNRAHLIFKSNFLGSKKQHIKSLCLENPQINSICHVIQDSPLKFNKDSLPKALFLPQMPPVIAVVVASPYSVPLQYITISRAVRTSTAQHNTVPDVPHATSDYPYTVQYELPPYEEHVPTTVLLSFV
jgi:hypothetical protein